jgi:hypothetical protein
MAAPRASKEPVDIFFETLRPKSQKVLQACVCEEVKTLKNDQQQFFPGVIFVSVLGGTSRARTVRGVVHDCRAEKYL